MNPETNRYDASTLISRYIFLCLLFSKIKGRISGRPNVEGHVGKAPSLFTTPYIVG